VCQDALVFVVRKYSSWEELKEVVLPTTTKVLQILKKKLDGIVMEYINDFRFPNDEFSFPRYFNLSPVVPDQWTLNIADFHLGVNFSFNLESKIIVRLRGMPPGDPDSVFFRMESYCEDLRGFEESRLESKIDVIHEQMTRVLLQSITDETKTLHGVKLRGD
jgi:uncharacterized protein (TIGR04255 family)